MNINLEIMLKNKEIATSINTIKYYLKKISNFKWTSAHPPKIGVREKNFFKQKN